MTEPIEAGIRGLMHQFLPMHLPWVDPSRLKTEFIIARIVSAFSGSPFVTASNSSQRTVG
jgi:hypothetical protein